MSSSSQPRRGGGGGERQRGGSGGGGGRGRSSGGANSSNPSHSNPPAPPSQPPRSSSSRGGTPTSSSSTPGSKPRRTNSHNNRSRTRPSRNAVSADEDASNSAAFLRDEDVLIAFMPYLKGDNAEAAKIHEEYQVGSDQEAFLRAARDFLLRERRAAASAESSSSSAPPAMAPSAAASSSSDSALPPPAPSTQPAAAMSSPPPAIERYEQGGTNTLFSTAAASAATAPTNPSAASPVVRANAENGAQLYAQPPLHQQHSTFQGSDISIPRSDSGLETMKSIENGLAALLTDDPIVALPPVHQHPQSTWGRGSSSAPQAPGQRTPPRAATAGHPPGWGGAHDPIPAGGGGATLPGFSTPGGTHRGVPTSPSSSFSLTPQMHNHGIPSAVAASSAASPWNHLAGGSPQMQGPPPPPPPAPSMSLPPSLLQSSSPFQLQPPNSAQSTAAIGSPRSIPGTGAPIDPSRQPPSSLATNQPDPTSAARAIHPPDESNGTPAKKPTTKEAFPVKRMWMHYDEQPGRVFVNGFDGADPSFALYFGPRQELTAHWSVPLDYLHRNRPGCTTLEQAIAGLTVGLFRRGCIENGMQASIISKKVVGEDNRTYDYRIDSSSNSVRGKVPFYSPRTPGHVLFRLYWEQDPIKTLAMGPTLHIRVLENDFDSSIRFILSNFKGKKSNPTSLSSVNSLAQVLETHVTTPNESAARAVFGCIQEARKVLEACASDYLKTTNKLAELEASVEDLKKQIEEEDAKSHEVSELSHDDVDEDEHGLSEIQISLREKIKVLLSGRASCERKWRDSQLSFASILKATVTNQSLNILLRRDMLAKMRLEYALFCPLCEEFAVPTESAKMWYEPLRDLPQNVTTDDFLLFAQARARMQVRTLGFEPNTSTLSDILFPRNRNATNQRSMDPRAVNVFNVMSTAMGQWYQELFADEERVVRQREMIRHHTEKCVQECGAFPPGTRVVIFGSSANGFGSPKSDIDMCLQLPQGEQLQDEESSGSTAMSKLAEYFESHGMKDVDTCRLTARIPVIKFYCPDPMSADNTSEAIECDLSMHNPLAVLNTALLRTYAEITPVTRVLAAVVKRWAKARDINNPARHTLSSYGYIIMLLHYMTYHKRSGNGLVSPVAAPEGDPALRQQPGQQAPPLLPNLQWMDPMWPNFPRGTPYRDLPSIPRNIIQHPRVEGKKVNTYFYRPSTPNDKAVLQMLFPGQDLSLAILLASFFRYYAYEFDYKRFVVSLHSTAARGLVEREVKAELDGWRHYSASLTVEDPFETFYDVAHVLRGGYYHRIRREFAVAYTKIADAASGRTTSNWKGKDISNLSGQELIDWVCEPAGNERDHTQLESDPIV